MRLLFLLMTRNRVKCMTASESRSPQGPHVDLITSSSLRSAPLSLYYISLSSRCRSFPFLLSPSSCLSFLLFRSLPVSILNLSQVFKTCFPNSISFLIVTVLMKISTSPSLQTLAVDNRSIVSHRALLRLLPLSPALSPDLFIFTSSA